MNRPEWLIIHHTGGSVANPNADTSHHTFEVVDAYHRGLWQFKSSLGHFIGYHYFIDKTGKVTQGRGNLDEGAHCIGKNKSSIGICLAGNFDVTLPTPEQETALKWLLTDLTKKFKIPAERIVPHRAFSNKSCYGRKLRDDWARGLIKVTPPPPLKPSLKDYTIEELFAEIMQRIKGMGK